MPMPRSAPEQGRRQRDSIGGPDGHRSVPTAGPSTRKLRRTAPVPGLDPKTTGQTIDAWSSVEQMLELFLDPERDLQAWRRRTLERARHGTDNELATRSARARREEEEDGRAR